MKSSEIMTFIKVYKAEEGQTCLLNQYNSVPNSILTEPCG